MSSTLVLNRAARHNYKILDEYEAGLVLLGSEVKAIIAGHTQLKAAYLWFSDQNELFLHNCSIMPITTSNFIQHEPTRVRKVLLHKKEIINLKLKCKREHLSLIPLSMYYGRGYIKLKVGLAQPLKIHDKRQQIKEKEFQKQKNKIF